MMSLEDHLCKNLITAKTKISKCNDLRQRNTIKLRTLNELFFNDHFLDSMGKWSAAIQMLTTMHCKRDKNIANNFTIEEKYLAFTMLTRSPRAYVFLSKSFTLPSPQELFNMFKKSSPQTGINGNPLNLLQTGLQYFQFRITLVFDEMNFKPNLCCNKDNVSGLVTYDIQTKRLLADHAQLYMIRGMVRSFKLPITYTLSSGPILGYDLLKQLNLIITQLQNLRIQVVALVFNEASNHLQALKILKAKARKLYCRNNQTPRENVIIINSQGIVPILDPPKLLQDIRNNLLTKDLKHLQKKSGTAKWNHIRMFYDKFGIMKLKGLTRSCVEPSEESKRQVLNAIQALSRTIALHMITSAGYDTLPEECCETCYLIYFFNNLFDSVNGFADCDSKSHLPLLQKITIGSEHHKTWVEARRQLANMTFITKDGHEVHVPMLNNWIASIEGVETLTGRLRKEYRIFSLWPRNLNMDPLVSLIESIQNNYPDSTSTVQQFEKAFNELLPPYWMIPPKWSY